jgi:pimeloyl-ACP methyl ester carboxylesterase
LYDFDGHGQSEWSGRDLTIDDLVKDLQEVITALGLEKVVLVGHSMNGVSLRLEARYFVSPQRLGSSPIPDCHLHLL